MMNMINRRQFLQITGGGAAGLLAGGLPSLINPKRIGTIPIPTV